MSVSRGAAAVNLIKGFLGAGFLTLPYASAQVGLIVSISGLLVLPFLNGLGVARYVQCDVLIENRDKEASCSTNHENVYGLGHAAEACNHALGLKGVAICAASILMAQIGSLVAYTKAVVVTMEHLNVDPCITLTFLGVCYFALSLLRDMKNIAIVSSVAILVYSVVIVLLIEDGWQRMATQGIAEDAIDPQPGFGHWLGMTIWSFEGCNTALFVYRAMALPLDRGSRLRPFWEALILAYSFGIILYMFVTIYGLLSYGLEVKQLVYFDFHSSGAVAVCQLALCTILTLSFPLNSVPPLSFLDGMLGFVPYTLRRATYVATILAFAAVVPDVASVTAFVGAVGFGFSGFVLPALCHWVLFRPYHEGRYIQCMLDLLLGTVGIVAIGLGLQDAGEMLINLVVGSGVTILVLRIRRILFMWTATMFARLFLPSGWSGIQYTMEEKPTLKESLLMPDQLVGA